LYDYFHHGGRRQEEVWAALFVPGQEEERTEEDDVGRRARQKGIEAAGLALPLNWRCLQL